MNRRRQMWKNKVTIGGYSQAFIWMCGKHGYLYGFHAIPNYKDPKEESIHEESISSFFFNIFETCEMESDVP